MTSHAESVRPVWRAGEPIYNYNGKSRNIGKIFMTLTPAYREFSKIQIREYVRAKGLDMHSEMIRVSRTMNGAKDCTLNEYHGRYSELFTFSCVTGDWRTATLFCRNEETLEDPEFRLCPADPEPAVPETIAKFVLWKTCEKNKNVMYEGKKVCDFAKSPLIKELPFQQWNAPCNIDKYFAAVAAVHNVYPDLNGKYQESCKHCEKENPKEEGNNTQSTWNVVLTLVGLC